MHLRKIALYQPQIYYYFNIQHLTSFFCQKVKLTAVHKVGIEA